MERERVLLGSLSTPWVPDLVLNVEEVRSGFQWRGNEGVEGG